MEQKEFVMIEPFEYTLEEIFEMKLLSEKEIPSLIKKFHKTLNIMKEKHRVRIDLQQLK